MSSPDNKAKLAKATNFSPHDSIQDVRIVDGVRLERAARDPSNDQAFWAIIRNSTLALSFDNYKEFIDGLFCSPGITEEPTELAGIDMRLPFPDVRAYRLLKAATELFLILRCGVLTRTPRYVDGQVVELDFVQLYIENKDRLGLDLGDEAGGAELKRFWQLYVDPENDGEASKADPDDFVIPYLARIRANLPVRTEANTKLGVYAELCDFILNEKTTRPCLISLIWSYWLERGRLNEAMRAISLRFQNKRARLDRDPLAELEIFPLRPLNNLLWGYIQDAQHRLTVERRAYEYLHHYGLSLSGAPGAMQPADRRWRFLQAFHNLLHKSALFYKDEDDTTVVADAFPILNAIRDVHLLLSEGAHNQFGDLPFVARSEGLMEQWLLARPEFDEFLPTRRAVAFPEPWMSRIEVMRRLQGWGEVSIRHYRDLAVFGEPLLLSIRYGDWSDIIDPNRAGNWAKFWRQEVQWYIHAYHAVTGVDLSAGVTEVRPVGPAAPAMGRPSALPAAAPQASSAVQRETPALDWESVGEPGDWRR
jgi:hypothetical protein